MKHSTNYALKPTDVQADFPAVIQRSRGRAEKLSRAVQSLWKRTKIDVIMGYGTIKGKGKIEVAATDGSKKMVEGKYIILATGARSREFTDLKQDGKKIIGYREAMSLPQQPKTMVIVGSGAIGVEFA